MFKRLSFIIFIISSCLHHDLDAQQLIKYYTYYGSAAKNKARKEFGISLVNKPNGLSAQFRLQNDYPDLEAPVELTHWEKPITESTSDGYLMLLHHKVNAFSHEYRCLLYDKQRQLTNNLDLCAIAGQSNCEIDDIRYDNHQLFWNFSCQTNAKAYDGKCCRLFCFDIARNELCWKSQYLTSRDIFTLDDRYVYTGYGFTNESDYVYLLDRNNGTILTQCPVTSAPKYIELTKEGLFVEDFLENGYIFRVTEESALRVTGETVRLRKGPSTNATIFSQNGNRPTFPLKGDILEYLGESGDFNRVRFNGQELYISKQFSTLNEIALLEKTNLPQAGVKAWISDTNANYVNFEVYDMKKFIKAVELMPTECNDLTSGTVYCVYIDRGLARGVYLSACQEYGAVLFILSDDNRLFAIDLLEATADDGTPLKGIELATGKSQINTFDTTQKKGISTVWAVDVNGKRKKVDLSPLNF